MIESVKTLGHGMAQHIHSLHCPKLKGQNQGSQLSRPTKYLPVTKWQKIYLSASPGEMPANDHGEYFFPAAIKVILFVCF